MNHKKGVYWTFLTLFAFFPRNSLLLTGSLRLRKHLLYWSSQMQPKLDARASDSPVRPPKQSQCFGDAAAVITKTEVSNARKQQNEKLLS